MEPKDRGLDKVDRAIDTCNELLRLTLAQHKAIADENLEQLAEIIERREDVISSLHLLGADLFADNAEAGVELLTIRQSAVRDKLDEVLRVDEECRKELQVKLADTKAQLTAVSRGRQALSEYAYLKPETEAIFVDERR